VKFHRFLPLVRTSRKNYQPTTEPPWTKLKRQKDQESNRQGRKERKGFLGPEVMSGERREVAVQSTMGRVHRKFSTNIKSLPDSSDRLYRKVRRSGETVRPQTTFP
jgi:hypothetical protein